MIDLDNMLRRALTRTDDWPKLYVRDGPFEILLDEAEFGGANHAVRDPAFAFVEKGESSYSVFVSHGRGGGYTASYERFDADEEEEWWSETVRGSVRDVVAVSDAHVVDRDDELPEYDEDATADSVLAAVRDLLQHVAKPYKSLWQVFASAPPKVWFEVLQRPDAPEFLLQRVGETATWQPLTLLVAIHPLTPPEALFALSDLWPDQVAENMGLALHLLATPGDFAKLSERAKEAYDRHLGENK